MLLLLLLVVWESATEVDLPWHVTGEQPLNNWGSEISPFMCVQQGRTGSVSPQPDWVWRVMSLYRHIMISRFHGDGTKWNPGYTELNCKPAHKMTFDEKTILLMPMPKPLSASGSRALEVSQLGSSWFTQTQTQVCSGVWEVCYVFTKFRRKSCSSCLLGVRCLVRRMLPQKVQIRQPSSRRKGKKSEWTSAEASTRSQPKMEW